LNLNVKNIMSICPTI